MAGFLPGPSQLYSTEHVVTMFERDSFTDLDASSSSGDEIIGLLVNEPGMNKLCDVGAVSYPSFLPSRTPGLLAQVVPWNTSFYSLTVKSLILFVKIAIVMQSFQDKYPYSYRYYPENGLNQKKNYKFLSTPVCICR